MDTVQKLTKRLKDAGYSVTKPRKTVFSALTDSEAVSMAQLVKMVADDIDRTSVYRTVDLFEKLGIIHRIHIGWKYKIELSEQYSHHHHHAACTQCGSISSFEEDQDLEADIHALAEKLGYTLEGHTLELRGVCGRCSDNVAQ